MTDDWKVMVEAPRRLPSMGDAAWERQEVRWCARCSLSQSHEPIPPKDEDGYFAIIGPHPDAWCVSEVARLIRLMKVEDDPLLLSAIYCPEESPTDSQRAQCQMHAEIFMRDASQPLVVVVGRMAPVSLGFDNRAHLAGRVGIWHDPVDDGAGCFVLFVDAPDGHNNHHVLDQLYPLPGMLNGTMSLMKLVGAGDCAFGECSDHTFMLDKGGIPWCKRHQWNGVDDGRVKKRPRKKYGKHNRGAKKK